MTHGRISSSSRALARTQRFLVALVALVALGLLPTLSGCGYSEQEMQAQIDKTNRLKTENGALKNKLGQTDQELAAAKARVDELENQLKAAGVDIESLRENLAGASEQMTELATTLEEREKALAEYKARAKQLEKIKARFELLRQKLNELTKLGLKVNIRRNRMVISLPGDVLFDSGRDKLRKEGEDILGKVATVIRNDKSLKGRYYQVAGHTDDQALKGGIFRDNWGLSLMRARTVLLYLVDPKEGALPLDKWSAAGFADTDPIASNDTDDGRQQNRRCELIVVPSVEEMLDLKAIAK